MACSAASTALLSSNPGAFSTKAAAPMASISKPFSQTLTIPKSFNGLRRPIQSHAPRSLSLSRGSQSRRSFVVRASSELPLVGNVAPDFEAEAVFDQEFIKVKLSEYIGKKYVILFFYPLDFTFVCPTEITAFSDRHAEFEKLNTEILGVSIDSVFSHLAWVQTDRKSGGLGDLKYPLISDVTKSISKSYGVLIPDQGIALRGLFIIDKEGVIQHSTINNLAIGRSVDETKRTLQALQYVQENPDEVCPAGWKPGEKSMKPDPKLSKEPRPRLRKRMLVVAQPLTSSTSRTRLPALAAALSSPPPLDLTEDNVAQVLADARVELAQIFDSSVGITGVVELADLDGPFVKISLKGRFWHKRSDVLARVANYLKQRIPEILEVDIEDEKQLDDSPENF
ncbi:hypothetical protein FH972_016671 [Carpinus fangiana]|uniref:thioredoxin-dependent peroxiredoxin n=1 Tax=Carpinus fangiana TaxID=176857 RepID=A0A5N6RJX4_9ROSI|nr:hypothetical protein FH972_016671 [Carpinus fangiana]